MVEGAPDANAARCCTTGTPGELIALVSSSDALSSPGRLGRGPATAAAAGPVGTAMGTATGPATRGGDCDGTAPAATGGVPTRPNPKLRLFGSGTGRLRADGRPLSEPSLSESLEPARIDCRSALRCNQTATAATQQCGEDTREACKSLGCDRALRLTPPAARRLSLPLTCACMSCLFFVGAGTAPLCSCDCSSSSSDSLRMSSRRRPLDIAAATVSRCCRRGRGADDRSDGGCSGAGGRRGGQMSRGEARVR